MKEVSNESLEKVVTALLGRILESQKFAEAKNAGMIVLNSAWLVASVNLLSSDKQLPSGLVTALMFALPLMVLSLLFAVGTLLPRMNLHQLIQHDEPGDECLIYFRHIAQIPTGEYADRLRERYRSKDGKGVTDEFINDMAGQIRANSRITSRKFTLFNLSALASASACLILCVPGLIWLCTLSAPGNSPPAKAQVEKVQRQSEKPNQPKVVPNKT